MNTALGAARALLARSYLSVQNALISARDALRIALREGDPVLAEQARARLRGAHREDLITDAERMEPAITDGRRYQTVRIVSVQVQLQIDGEWRPEGEPETLADAIMHFDRLVGCLKFHGAWAREALDLNVTAVRIADDDKCHAYWKAEEGDSVIATEES